ncbi:MAG: hypothetical protein KA094_01430 [Methanoregulaceae archaeon]|jgi:hypothetical protein|nr:hypothetical protein [Methanoregulaceae archaeon]HPA07893.1 hypothetical protein [Methanoregulaceae archaeon]HQJ38655.1 hypothetical protein [Methanoregulaceae archaeon]HQN89552.1 hypothetical protein [Methanoregulaceae archaeon]HQP82335.1 hypothetical protein [Methanoregulaceae archaeon]
MSCRTWLFLLCFLLVITPANALCHWAPEVTPPPGVPPCRGYPDSLQQPWPRLPTDTEIETAKEEYLAYQLEGSERRRIDSVVVAKYHTCEGTWINHVDMEMKYSWWWESVTGEGEWQPSTAYTFLIYDPARNRFEFVLDIGMSPYFLGFITNPVQGFATGSCSSGGGAVVPTVSGGSVAPESDDNSWVVIIGAIAVIGGGLAIGAKKLAGGKGEKDTREKKKKEKKEPEKVRYILQLSTDRVTVTPDSAASLKVTAWKIVGTSPPAPAPEAAITLTVPAGNEGLSVQPASGTGSVEASVALVSQVAKSPVLITVTASAGKSSVSAQVTVEIPAEYLMEFF